MALTASANLALGTALPPFELRDTVSNALYSEASFADAPGLVVMFICNHCPYVIHINKILSKFATEFIASKVAFLAISSNDVSNYPQDGPNEMARVAKELDYPFPYLFDADQSVAKLFGAECTPDFFVYNQFKSLVYHGQFDSSRPSNDLIPSGKDLKAVLQALLSGSKVQDDQIPSIGCNIKWKK